MATDCVLHQEAPFPTGLEQVLASHYLCSPLITPDGLSLPLMASHYP